METSESGPCLERLEQLSTNANRAEHRDDHRLSAVDRPNPDANQGIVVYRRLRQRRRIDQSHPTWRREDTFSVHNRDRGCLRAAGNREQFPRLVLARPVAAPLRLAYTFGRSDNAGE